MIVDNVIRFFLLVYKLRRYMRKYLKSRMIEWKLFDTKNQRECARERGRERETNTETQINKKKKKNSRH